ncbi:hypothetical protein C8F01DRAFT_1167531 [Mycena amicta]|nr:hypothetical protein C8F01DRAFT_1167531 [Mycena amicta]
MAQNRQLWTFVQGAPAVPTSHYELPDMSTTQNAVFNGNGKRLRIDEPLNDNTGYSGLPIFAAPTAPTPTIVQPSMQWQMPPPTITTTPALTVMGAAPVPPSLPTMGAAPVAPSLPMMYTTPAAGPQLPTMAPAARTKVDVYVGPANWPGEDDPNWRRNISASVLDVYPRHKIDGQYSVHKPPQYPTHIILKFNSSGDADKFIGGWTNSRDRIARFPLVIAGRLLN